METFLMIMAGIAVCALFFLTGFIAGKGQITVVAPLTKEQKEKQDELLRRYEATMEEMNMVYS